jgi:CDP-glucose 4,6-dehydratase
VNAPFWAGKRVVVTGHTGFKGGWLSLWLQKLGANVAGYALPAAQADSLFELARVGERMESMYGDIRDPDMLRMLFEGFRPDIVFHLAAQALVRESYIEPVATYDVNVMGTVHLLEAARGSPSCRVVVNVTSDKCYENKEWAWGYRESDPMGGHDPYSSSKGCAELVTAAYRRSFFEGRGGPSKAIATARAGNVIGGGDFSKDRIVPDFMTASLAGTSLHIRNPDAVRPWQHVLEPLSGYLLLAEKLWDDPLRYSGGWNFGPSNNDIRSVRWIVEKLNEYRGNRISWVFDTTPKPHEANLLALESAKARMMLGWKPRWSLEQALRAVVNWYGAYENGEPLRDLVTQQIASYEAMTERSVGIERTNA